MKKKEKKSKERKKKIKIHSVVKNTIKDYTFTSTSHDKKKILQFK